MKNAYNFHCDPSHGWGAIPIKDVFELGLSINDFSEYSYKSRSGNTLYLEEDTDLIKFYEVFKTKLGVVPNFIEKHINNRHWIRSMPSLK